MNFKYVPMFGIISSLSLFHIFFLIRRINPDSSALTEQLSILSYILAVIAFYEVILLVISLIIGYHESINPSMGLGSLFTNVFLGSLLFKLIILIIMSLTIVSTFQGEGLDNVDVDSYAGEDIEYIFEIFSECLLNAIVASTICSVFPSKGKIVKNKREKSAANPILVSRKIETHDSRNRYDAFGNDRVEIYVKSMIDLGYDEDFARNNAEEYYKLDK